MSRDKNKNPAITRVFETYLGEPCGKSHTINSSYQIRFFRIVENLYVNGEYRDDSAIGKLMHDFNCADADDMHYGLLAERTRYLKENSKGVNEMYRTMDEVEKECYEEGREKGRETQAELTAINLRKLGLPLEQIAHAVGFHVEKVEKWVK